MTRARLTRTIAKGTRARGGGHASIVWVLLSASATKGSTAGRAATQPHPRQPQPQPQPPYPPQQSNKQARAQPQPQPQHP